MRNKPAVFLLVCALAALMPFVAPSPAAVDTVDFPGWPRQFEGRALQPLPLSEIEQRFAAGFPGRIGRFTDGQREIVIRWVSQPTRQLHPAADCFKGSGYAVTPLPIERIQGERWSAFEAERSDASLHVRETIMDEQNARWTDMSSWYWLALLDQTQGPWWAITVATASPRSGDAGESVGVSWK